jgi:hypothetical protein
MPHPHKSRQDGPPPDTRHGPRWLGALVAGLSRPAFRRRAPAAAALLADWPAVVGPALAAVTQPLRLSVNTLTIRCAGPVAMELQHLAPELIARINTHAGHALVASLRFQSGPVASAAAMPPPPPAAPADESGLDAVADPGLRAALAALRARLR